MTTIESLEPRQFLAADLTALLSTYTLPANQKAGTLIKGTATVLLSNKDTKALPPSTKKVTVTISLRIAGSPDVVVGTAKNISLAGLAKSKPAKSVPVSLTLPKSLPAGTFSLVAVVDSTHLVPESNENNNSALSSKKFTLKPGAATPGADLTLSAHTATLKSDGTQGSYSVTIKNIGTATSAPIHYTVVATSPGLPEQILDESDSFFPTLPPGKTDQLTDFPLDAIINHNPTPNTFTVEFRITAGDAKTANNVTSLGTVTLPATLKFATPSNGTNPVTIFTGSPSLAFTSTSHTENATSGAFDDKGTLTDSHGHTGTYQYKTDGFTPPTLSLDLYDAHGFLITYYLDFGYGLSQTPPPFTSLNGKVLNFSSTSNTDAIASADDLSGGTILFITLG